MFEFFRDTYYEIKGIDSKLVKDEKKRMQYELKADKYIFSKNAKIIVLVMGTLYLLTVIMVIPQLKYVSNWFLHTLKYILLLGLDVTACVCLFNKNKKTEIISLACIFLFIVMNYAVAFSHF